MSLQSGGMTLSIQTDGISSTAKKTADAPNVTRPALVQIQLLKRKNAGINIEV